VRLNSVNLGGWMQAERWRGSDERRASTRVLDSVEDADWAADGETMAVVRYVPENRHWRLEFPIGKVLFESPNWISHPKISPDGKWVALPIIKTRLATTRVRSQ